MVQGIPVLLRSEQIPTLWVAKASWELAQNWIEEHSRVDPWFVHSLGLTQHERDELLSRLKSNRNEEVDPVISYLVGATSGLLYQNLRGRLSSTPIPTLNLGNRPETLLDIGCNWGRWTLSAAQQGHLSVGIDPSLGAVLAAQRLAKKLGTKAWFVCGDGRFLPFASHTFSRIFSYSVIQHLSESDARQCLSEIHRTLTPNGKSVIQMPNCFGFRSLYHLVRRRFRKATDFDVRYWTPWKLQHTFKNAIGKTSLSIDGFFGLGVQASDYKILPPTSKGIILISEFFKQIAKVVPPMKYVADSLFLHSTASE